MDSPCIKQTVFKVLKIFQHRKYLVAYVLKRGMNAYFICNNNCRQRRSRLNAAYCGISSGSTLLAKTKMISGKNLQFRLEIKTCDPLNYTMDHSKFIASIQKEEFISSFKSSASYYIQQQSLNYMYT